MMQLDDTHVQIERQSFQWVAEYALWVQKEKKIKQLQREKSVRLVALTGTSQWCQPLDVQGRDSKTDAALSRSCRRADERGGEVSKGRGKTGSRQDLGRQRVY